ncbi:hypothetical protein [Paenibacillus dendritiformis]|nr:hypothetical protein [Paenibacillus dendritiformis]
MSPEAASGMEKGSNKRRLPGIELMGGAGSCRNALPVRCFIAAML